jgi:uncharacterized membrane protein
MTERKRSVLRGVALLILAAAMTFVTVNTIMRGPFGDPVAWAITVVFVEVLTVLFLVGLAWSDLSRSRHPGRRRQR